MSKKKADPPIKTHRRNYSPGGRLGIGQNGTQYELINPSSSRLRGGPLVQQIMWGNPFKNK